MLELNRTVLVRLSSIILKPCILRQLKVIPIIPQIKKRRLLTVAFLRWFTAFLYLYLSSAVYADYATECATYQAD